MEKTYEVIYLDGNERLFGTENIILLMEFLMNEKNSENIIEIKTREAEK